MRADRRLAAALALLCLVGLLAAPGRALAEGLRYREPVAERDGRARSTETARSPVRSSQRTRGLDRADGQDTWLPAWLAAFSRAIAGEDPAVRERERRRIMAARQAERARTASAGPRVAGPARPPAATTVATPREQVFRAPPAPASATTEPAPALRRLSEPPRVIESPAKPTAPPNATPPAAPVARAPAAPAPEPAAEPQASRPLVTGALTVPPPPQQGPAPQRATEPAAQPNPPIAAPSPVPVSPPVVVAARPIETPPQPTAPAGDPAAGGPEIKGARATGFDVVRVRRDLPKLELASRVYAERRLSGEPVFRTDPDWVVLEHAADSMSEADWAAARASGFEAVAYINDAQRLIVVAIAGTQDLKRDFLANNVWRALIRAEAPQQFYFAKQYIKSVTRRYLPAGYTIECVGHSLGGGACAYAGAELGIVANVINPISAGRLEPSNEHLITNYIVDGDIARLVYGARGNEFSGQVQVIDRTVDQEARRRIAERWGRLGGIAVVVQDLRGAIDGHRVDAALDRIARMADVSRPR